MEIFPLPAEVATKRALRGEEEEELLSKHDGMTSSSIKTKNLQPLGPNLSKDELYQLYLEGKLYIIKEHTHDKTVILRYLEPIRSKVEPNFVSIYNDLWDSIIDDDLLGVALWKTQGSNRTAFNKYTLFRILGVLLTKSVYSQNFTAKECSRLLEASSLASTLRTYMSKGLDYDATKRIRAILKNFECV